MIQLVKSQLSTKSELILELLRGWTIVDNVSGWTFNSVVSNSRIGKVLSGIMLVIMPDQMWPD